MGKIKIAKASDAADIIFKQDQNASSVVMLFRNVAALIIIMSLCTAVSMLFKNIGAFESNIVMIYLLGILLFSYFAGGYIYSLFASVCGVLLYNFFFTQPYFTLQVYNHDYPVTFLVMFTVGSITSMLTLRVRRETRLAEDRELRIKALYQVGRRLLEVKSSASLAKVCAHEIARLFHANVLVKLSDASGNLDYKFIEGDDVFSDDNEYVACMETYQSGNPCGLGTALFSDRKAYYIPITSQSGVIGVVGISMPGGLLLSDVQKEFIDAIVPQIAVVLEREKIYEKQQEAQVEIQRERLRSDMLRAISHDLRTPLTSIMGLASTALNNYDTVSDDVKKDFLYNIFDDADWLNELVENILNMTRFEEGKVKLNISIEAAEELISEAIGHVKKRAPKHRFIAKMPDEVILFEVDSILIRQVLVNILSNAVNYSPEGSEITVLLSSDENNVIFEISDNGPGISPQDLPFIFERFYSGRGKNLGARRGTGLGLSLCKSIVEAHGGEISIKNNKPHGTVVIFYIPIKGEAGNGAADTDCR